MSPSMRQAFIIIGLAAVLAPTTAHADWVCKPAWAFSGMGDKTYTGDGSSEAEARQAASGRCVLENRGLELDDFCLVAPKGDEWHCSRSDPAVSGVPSKS